MLCILANIFILVNCVDNNILCQILYFITNNIYLGTFSKYKGGLFYLVQFKDKINEYEFESGDNYYIYVQHNNIIRINICS